MTALRAKIRLPDLARIWNNLDSSRIAVRDLKPGFKASEPKVHRAVKEWFDSEGRGGWVGLTKKTIDARANRWGYYRRGFREGPVHRILHARHTLRRSLTKRGGKNISYMQHNVWRFGSEVPWAAAHDPGEGTFRASGLPVRRIIPRGELKKIVREELGRHVMRPLTRGR